MPYGGGHAGGRPCKEIFGGLKVKQSVGMPEGLPGPKFTAEVSCDSIKAEAEFNLLEGNAGIFGTSMGFHGSAEFEKGGDFMLFAGPRMEAGGSGGGLGLEGGIKTGAFIKGNRGGLEDLGGRIELEGKASGLSGSAALQGRDGLRLAFHREAGFPRTAREDAAAEPDAEALSPAAVKRAACGALTRGT